MRTNRQREEGSLTGYIILVLESAMRSVGSVFSSPPLLLKKMCARIHDAYNCIK